VGETQNRPFRLSFNSSLKVDFQGSRVTSDGGLVLVRELDERRGEAMASALATKVSDNSVGNAAVSSVLFQYEADPRSLAA
jgi:hypothetical protein